MVMNQYIPRFKDECYFVKETNRTYTGVYKSNEKVFNNSRVRLPQIGQKQVADLQCNALTSLVHIIALEVSDFFLSFIWQS